ncbi:EIF4G2, partial [Cervus elaphus hippelaphus]
IVDKALEEPKYSSLYAQLCLRLAEDAPNFDGPAAEGQPGQKQSTVMLLRAEEEVGVHLSTIPRLLATASSWGKPQGKTLRNGFLHEALDEMTTPQQTTPQMKKNDMMQSSGNILNKLTPEKFDKLCLELLNVGVESKLILKGVILLIVDKALEEPKYSSLYAQLCLRLAEDAPNFDGPAAEGQPGQKQSTEEEQRAIAKIKMLGNIKFIGELGKLDLIHESILHKCIKTLLEKKKRVQLKDMGEDLECLCQIMRTVGPRLDHERAKSLMDQYFARMCSLMLSKELPARIRFLLQDTVELREHHWVPRKAFLDNGPKTINQIRQDAVKDLGVFIPAPMAQGMRSDFFLEGPFMPPRMKMDRDPLGGLADMFGQMPGSGIGTGPGVIQDRFSPTMGRHRSNQLFNGHGGHIMPPTQSQFGEMGGKFMKSQKELLKQIKLDPSPQTIYKWIKDNISPKLHVDKGFVNILMTSFLQYISSEVNPPSDETDSSSAPSKEQLEQEKQLLLSFKPVMQKFLHDHVDLQVSALYALQVHCYNSNFPKGMLLRFFVHFYDMEIIEEEAFLAWKEDITQEFPGKGKALFQMLSKVIILSLDRSDEDKEKASSLISLLKQEGIATSDNFMQAFLNVLDQCPKLEVDIPLVKSYLAQFAARAIISELSWSDSALGDAGRESISEPAERLRPDCRDSLSDCSEPEGLRFLAGWSLSESSSERGLRGRRGLPASLPDLFWFSSESLSEEAPFFRRSPSSESLLLKVLIGVIIDKFIELSSLLGTLKSKRDH